LDLTLFIGSTDSNTVLGQQVINRGNFSQQDITVTINPELDPATIDTEYDRIIAIEGEEVPLLLTLSTINTADMETTVVEVTGLPDGFSISGASFDSGTWTVDEANIASASIIGGNDLFGEFILDIKPVSQLDGNTIAGNNINILVRVSEVNDSGETLLTGTNGNDRVYSNDDDQTIIAGKGEDIITTGSGQDTLVFNKGDGNVILPPTDTVTDFDGVSDSADVNFDTLDLTSMLSDFDTTTIDKIDDLIDIADNGNGGTTLQIVNNLALTRQTIVLDDITTVELNGGSAPTDQAELLQKMIDDQTLVVNS
jgi:Ca2+-binding RTX toxin-like protein